MERNQEMKTWLMRYPGWAAWCFYGCSILVSSLVIQPESGGKSALALTVPLDGTVAFLILIYELFLFWLLMQWLSDEIIGRGPVSLLQIEGFYDKVSAIGVLSFFAVLGMGAVAGILQVLVAVVPEKVLTSIAALLPPSEILLTIIEFLAVAALLLFFISLAYGYVLQHSVFNIPFERRLVIYSDFLTGQLKLPVGGDDEDDKDERIEQITRVFRDSLQLASDEFSYNHNMKVRNLQRFVTMFQFLACSSRPQERVRLADLTRSTLLSATSLDSPFDFIRALNRMSQELDSYAWDLSRDIESLPSFGSEVVDIAGHIPLLKPLILFFVARLL